MEPKKRSFSYFFAIALVLAAIVFFLLLGHFGQYRSDVSIIFIPKNEKTASISEQIINNLAIVPEKQSFYNKLIIENQDIKNSFSNFSDYQKNTSARREGNSSIVNISATRKNPKEAENIAKTSAFTLFNVFSHYYDIKTDIDLRIIDGPNTKLVYGNLWSIILLSLVLGIILSFLINSILDFIFGYAEKKDIIPIKVPQFDFSKLKFPAVSIRKKAEKKKPEIQETTKPETQETKKPAAKAQPAPAIASSSKKSSAPENLPFIDEDYFRSNIIKSNGSSKKKEEKPEEPKKESQAETPKAPEEPKASTDYKREPTQEELKKRLNKLLRGEL